MPTIYWIRETAEDRFWENQPPPHFPRERRKHYACPHCRTKFWTATELRSHVGLNHPLELPALVLRGVQLADEEIVRSRITEKDIAILNSSRCEVQINGGPWQAIGEPEFKRRFAQATNTNWKVRLTNKNRSGFSYTTSMYNIHFRIPCTDNLNKIDVRFMEDLAIDVFNHADLERFQLALPDDAGAREYGSALGDYALGVLLKENLQASFAPIDASEYKTKMSSALDTLQQFHRPVALTVASAIRFNLNAFEDPGTSTPTDLEYALRFFRERAGLPGAMKVARLAEHMERSGAASRVCPIDQTTHILIRASGQLVRGERLSATQLAEIWQAAEQRQLSGNSYDIAKIRVILAEGFSRLNDPCASTHFRKLAYHPIFKNWAQQHLKGII